MTTTLVLPDRMKSLPTDSEGRPVPWYAAVVDGEPDLRSVREDGFTDAIRFKLCWICGKATGKYGAFLLNAKCAVNQVATDPPSHRDCAQYAAQVLLGAVVTLVWVTRDWYGVRDGSGQPLIRVGSPDQTYWYADGRAAGRDEALEAVEAVMPGLRVVAAEGGPVAAIQLEKTYGRALELMPA